MARPPSTSTTMATAIATDGMGKRADAYPVYMENAAILPIPLKIKIALIRIRPASDTTLFEEFIACSFFPRVLFRFLKLGRITPSQTVILPNFPALPRELRFLSKWPHRRLASAPFRSHALTLSLLEARHDGPS